MKKLSTNNYFFYFNNSYQDIVNSISFFPNTCKSFIYLIDFSDGENIFD